MDVTNALPPEGQLWSDKTPAQIVADINSLLTGLHTDTLNQPHTDTLIMPVKTYRYLYYRDRPMLKILHDAGWSSGFTVNGFEPPEGK